MSAASFVHSNRSSVVMLVGPTASGKSAAAIALAKQFAGEIVSIDSALVYRDMDVGTAKPTAAERTSVPHHLIDVIAPTESYSVARFAADCRAAVNGIHHRGHLPLLVGGTMMYANVLLHGMSELPPTDPAVRAQVQARCAAEGIAALHAELARVDPVMAARLPATDTQRIERAIEVWLLTGTPLSSLQGQRRSVLADLDLFIIRWLPRTRAWLHLRCEERLNTMFAHGLVAEVEQLRHRYALHPDLPSMRCVGYRQVLDVLEHRAPREELFDRTLFATRQLAKRQTTWLRSFPGDEVACDAPDAVARAAGLIADWLGSRGGAGGGPER